MKTIYIFSIKTKTKEQMKKVKSSKSRLCPLKDPSQPPPFSMPSKLLILHGEAKSDSFTIGCVPESMFNYL